MTDDYRRTRLEFELRAPAVLYAARIYVDQVVAGINSDWVYDIVKNRGLEAQVKIYGLRPVGKSFTSWKDAPMEGVVWVVSSVSGDHVIHQDLASAISALESDLCVDDTYIGVITGYKVAD